jgi:hypothetical protein
MQWLDRNIVLIRTPLSQQTPFRSTLPIAQAALLVVDPLDDSCVSMPSSPYLLLSGGKSVSVHCVCERFVFSRIVLIVHSFCIVLFFPFCIVLFFLFCIFLFFPFHISSIFSIFVFVVVFTVVFAVFASSLPDGNQSTDHRLKPRRESLDPCEVIW